MRRGIHAFLCCLSVVAVMAAAAVDAQDQRQQGQGQRRPGQRGFGQGGGPGGFFGGGGGGGGSTSYLQLLGVEKVRQELEVTEDQQADLVKVGEEARTKMREVFSGFGNFRDLTEEQRDKQREESQAKMATINRETEGKVEDVLLPHQVDRLKEIAIQIQGIGALNDPKVQEELKLSAKQKEDLQAVRDSNREKIRELFQGGDREGNREKLDQFRKDSEAQTLAVLSSDQKSQFEKMKGKPFEIDRSELFRGFGGQGGPGRGQPGQGGQPRRPGQGGGQPGGGGRPQRPASENPAT